MFSRMNSPVNAVRPGPGQVLGGHVIRRAIAAGASGSVWLAQTVATGDWAALKVFQSAAGLDAEDRDDQQRRFAQEADIASRLEHPGIVRILGAGEDRGLLWLAMEPVPGCSLQRYVTPDRLLPPAIALQTMEKLAHALAHAHAQGVQHRDIKPSNILLDLPSGTVKLTDFGTAKFADHSRTRTGVMLGTPSYMAPEQLAGAPTDARADLYAVGVVLFELLTGRRPHEAASMGEFMRAVATQTAPDLRVHWPAAPADLAQLLADLLHKRPAERLPSAGLLADRLLRVRLHGGNGFGTT
jgi:eukaryotic-like serine/threonine-protein kinase